MSSEIDQALAGALGEERQSDAVLSEVQKMLAVSRAGVVPGYQLAVSGIYPSFTVSHTDETPESRDKEEIVLRAWQCRPSWANKLCTVVPAAYGTDDGGVIVPTIGGVPMHMRKPVVPMHPGGGMIALENSVRFNGDGTRTLMGSQLVSYRLGSIPAWPRVYYLVYATSDRVVPADPGVVVVGYTSLAWYGADGVLSGGDGGQVVTNITNPAHPGFGIAQGGGTSISVVEVYI